MIKSYSFEKIIAAKPKLLKFEHRDGKFFPSSGLSPISAFRSLQLSGQIASGLIWRAPPRVCMALIDLII